MVIKLNKNVMFLIKFLALFLLFYFLIYNLPIIPLQNFIASQLANFLSLQHSSHYIFINNHNFSIEPDCTGLISLSMLASLLLALKKPSLKRKLLLFILSIFLIFPFNFLRLVLVLSIAKLSFQYSLITHTISWFFMAIFVLSIWYFIIERVYKIKIDKTFL